MATTTVTTTTCDYEPCSKEKTEKNGKEWIKATVYEQFPGNSDPILMFGAIGTIEWTKETQLKDRDFCSSTCAHKFTAALLKWKTPGVPRGSRKKKAETAGATV